MNTTFTCRQPSLSVNHRNDIIERDEQGNIVGAWYGYYNPKRFTVKLYPNRRHPFFRWNKEPVIKTISAGLVKCQRPAPNVVQRSIKSQTARVMRDLIGQEKIKF